jgi:cytosine/adenosine deaminase-related metal-dependent hydrolase
MLICAGTLVESSGRIHRPGHLRIARGIITEIGSSLSPRAGEELMDLPEITIAPGWINLHAHLELASLYNAFTPGKDFPFWLKQILTRLPGLTSEVRRQSIQRSSQEALRTGTTSIVSITSDISAMAGLTSTASRVWWALEFMDIQSQPEVSAVVDRAMAWLSRNPANAWHLALSPHAPYTASPKLYQEILTSSSVHKLPFTTHLAESPEETSLLAGEETSFRDILSKDLQRRDFGNSKSPVDWCKQNQALPDAAILAHVNELQPSDLPYLKERRVTVVHCPTSHEWFARKSFPFELLRDNGIPVCIGTDSPASSPNFQLDLRQEIRLFLERHSNVSPQEAWELITTAPARALGYESKLGTLQPGSCADWVGWHIPKSQDPIPLILQGMDPAEISCVGGNITFHKKI